MRKIGMAMALIAALGLFTGSIQAQESGKPRKQARQTPDRGVDDDKKAPEAEAKKGPTERSVEQVQVTVRSSGVRVAELDQSFDEALVVTINPDGTRTYTEVQGLERAAALVQQPAPAQTAPVLEEK